MTICDCYCCLSGNHCLKGCRCTCVPCVDRQRLLTKRGA